MNLQDLKTEYLARHRMSLDDSAVQHVSGFVAFLEATSPLALVEEQTLEQMVVNATDLAVKTARASWEGELQASVEGAVEAARLAWEEEAAAKAAGSSAMPAVAAALAPTESGGSDPAVVSAIETVAYPDSTAATGPGPLPADSPAA